MWCRGDCRRTATGLDIDQDALAWGCRENASGLLGENAGDRPRLNLLRCDVLDSVAAAECVSVLPGAGEAHELPGSRAATEHVDEPPGVKGSPQQAGSSGADTERLSGQPSAKGAGEQAGSESGAARHMSRLSDMAESCEQAEQGTDEAKCVSKLQGSCSSEAHGQANGSSAEAERMSVPGVLSGAGNAREPGGEGCAAPSAARPPCRSAGSGAIEPGSLSGDTASRSVSETDAAGGALRHGIAHAASSGPGLGPGSDPGADPDPAGQGADDLRAKPADIVCAMNFSVCLLHQRTEVQVRPQHSIIVSYDAKLCSSCKTSACTQWHAGSCHGCLYDAACESMCWCTLLKKCVLVMLGSICAAQLYFTRVRRAMSGEGGVFVMVRIRLKP